MIKTITYILPEYFACYLVNNDPSGLMKGEQALIDAFIERENLGFCVGVSEERFFTHYNDYSRLGADCLEYTFEVRN